MGSSQRKRSLGGGLVWLVLAACGARSENSPGEAHATQVVGTSDPGSQNTCPARAPAPSPLPHVKPELESLAYWLAHTPELDEPLLARDELAVHDRALRQAANGDARVVDLSRPVVREELLAALGTRFSTLQARFASGEYTSERRDLTELFSADLARELVPAPELHVALEPVALRCLPFAEPIHSTQGSTGFDRNSCSEARAQEPLEVLAKLRGQLLVRTRYALGFVGSDAPLSPRVPEELDALYRTGAELVLKEPLTAGEARVQAGTVLVSAGEGSAWLATAAGFAKSPAVPETQGYATARPLTRRAFLEEAFHYLGTPYGWGDEGGGRDCSRFVLDVLQTFGLHLPRHSAEQSLAGTYSVEVPESTSETERLALLDSAVARGIVLIQFPGHIMVYLGRDAEGVPRALHSFAEYLAPCPGSGETLFEVGRVAVSDLSLGLGTSRRSFLQRATRLTVFGAPPGYALEALTRFRAPLPPELPTDASCTDSLDAALFRSPRDPAQGTPVRVIAATTADLRPASLWLLDAQGQPVTAAVHELGAGPYAKFLELASPAAGRYTAVLADGQRVLACERFRVAPTPPPAPPMRAPDAPVWDARIRWERDVEHLYAAFVEQLFSHPVEDMRTWSSLAELLVDPQRNLLHDHLGQGEDEKLALRPDCADLAYFLRAYFAWKLALPFGFRQCSRGHAGRPPRCGELITQRMPVEAADGVSAFSRFIREHVGPGAHSASGRTLPSDDATDLYPLPLAREAIAPGSVFADPYGHVIVVAKWLPQGVAGAGMLLGADAQPDASIGRRRFWRGNFLFTPDTRDVGAGFKAFRPILAANDGTLAEPTQATWPSGPDHPAPSLEQYQGSADDFYDKLDELIYPRPIAMLDRMRQVVAALEEQVVRRVDAIDLGEGYMRTRGAPVEMPVGYDIFETAGAWEDFATPSRDLRLLIALDTVQALEGRVRKAPARFGVEPERVESAASELRGALDAELKQRRFHYTRSDGSSFELTLADVVARARELETAYNPNECVEARWGAPEGSSERAPCKRAMPRAQRARMEEYRPWFHTRTRPPRP